MSKDSIYDLYKDVQEDEALQRSYCDRDGLVGIDTYLVVECPKGHLMSVTWRQWDAGQRCLQCKKENDQE